MKNAVVIFVFTILVTLFYWYVGQQVPQKVTYPPKELEIRSDLTTEEMVEIGEELLIGKGTCASCHTIGEGHGGRFPDLGNIGAVAGSRVEGMGDVEYLAESMYDPNKFIVDGYLAGMPLVHKAPINLTDEEILTIIAYLQTLGGTATVTMQTTHSFTGLNPAGAGGDEAAAAAPAAASVPIESLDAKEVLGRYLCLTCHMIDAPTPLVGPSLYDVGKRLSRAEIYEAIMDPDLTVADGYAPGVMTAMLNGASFYDKLTTNELKVMVDFLASLKGE